MTIVHWKKPGDVGHFVRVTPKEALKLITSLSEQMRSGSPNVGREEFYTTDTQEYFSIAVHSGPTLDPPTPRQSTSGRRGKKKAR